MKKYLFLITLFLTALVASGATYYVVPGGAGNKNGTSWANAYADVQTAIDSAYNAGGGEVWIAKGTYKHGSAMTMKNNVHIYGGFAGTETSKEERVEGNNTILDGEGKYSVFYNYYTESNPLTNSAKLDNVTIQNGYSSGFGAGMHNYYASPEITNCTFTNNSTYYGGGGMYNIRSSSPKLTNCTFANNSAYYGGGGMYNNNSSSPKLTNCTFANNSASDYYPGGGMFNSSSSPTLTNCTFANNSAGSGGGMHNSGSSTKPALTNCTFTNNSAGSGGGMFNYGYNGTCNPTLTNCTFSNNSAGSGGGMYNHSSSSPKLTNCTFTNNSASSGGGMYNYGYNGTCNPTLTNCTFTNNSAEYDGGGMCNGSSSPTLTNCILWGNTASVNCNEILNLNSNSNPTIDTCIIKGGKDGISGSDYCTFTTEPITADPKLMPLGNYGGNVQTCPVGAGSSAIAAGKVVDGIITDARGFARSSTPTIGACEYQNKLTVASISTSEGYLKYSSSYEFTLNVNVPDVDGTFTYQWYKDGVAIKGATSSSYKTSQSVGTSKYTVEVSNGTTTITSSEITIETINPVIYVSTEGTSSNDGLSWATAKSDVQEAIDLASEYYGIEVWIAQGTYKHGSEMTMKNGVAIYGGFAGTETSKDQRVAGNNTILDGEGKYRVFYNNYYSSNRLTNSAKLDNVTIQNGYANGSNSSDKYGAGMYNYFASPEITNCTFTNNSAGGSYYYGYGGGIYNRSSSSPVLTNCTFSNNSASYGGGMYNSSSSPELTNCTFSGNTANSGGGMLNSDSDPTLTNCTFSGNSASSSGGGMRNGSSSPVLTNCTFTNNSAEYSGGGMYNDVFYGTCSPTLTNCTFSGNSASSSGGGMYNSSSSPELTNCILWGNTASSSGNEIYTTSNSNPTIDTCIIEGGYSSYGIYTNIITSDPKLMPLGNYGGNVQTCPVGTGSSAIGAGKVVDDVTTDARGVVRSTTAPTIGAYEYIKVKTPFESWAENAGLTGDNALPSATPHNDGITNLEKFTFGLDASKATSYGANASFKHTSDATGASLQFPVSVDAEGVVNVKALKSVGLVNWTESTATAAGETSSDGKFKIYKATAPVGEEGKVFLKLKVEEK